MPKHRAFVPQRRKRPLQFGRRGPLFAGQIDAARQVTNASYQQFADLPVAEKPDIVFAPWPVDSHRDHRATSLLVYDAG
jgi:LmbE family N-acetylglucosaminyl deacetylase